MSDYLSRYESAQEEDEQVMLTYEIEVATTGKLLRSTLEIKDTLGNSPLGYRQEKHQFYFEDTLDKNWVNVVKFVKAEYHQGDVYEEWSVESYMPPTDAQIMQMYLEDVEEMARNEADAETASFKGQEPEMAMWRKSFDYHRLKAEPVADERYCMAIPRGKTMAFYPRIKYSDVWAMRDSYGNTYICLNISTTDKVMPHWVVYDKTNRKD